MSNVIKAYTVRYDEKTKKFIDIRLKDMALEKRLKQELKAEGQAQDGFVEGLKAAAVELLQQENEKNLAGSVVQEAQMEAQRILEQANMEAARIKNEAFAQAQKRGYEEGMQKVRQEAQRLEEEYNMKLKGLEEERENILNELQPQIAEIIAGLVEKITGIVIKNREDVILYLVEKAMKNLDKCNELNIRVSSEDYDYLLSRRHELAQVLDREVAIHITEDPALLKNQCLIETESRIINCSLDLQLESLLTDIRLIGGI